MQTLRSLKLFRLIVALISIQALATAPLIAQQSGSTRKWGTPCADLFRNLFSGDKAPVKKEPRYPLMELHASSKADIAANVNGILVVKPDDLKNEESVRAIYQSKRRLFLRDDGVAETPQEFLGKSVERARVLLAAPTDEKGVRNIYGWQENKIEELSSALKQADGIKKKFEKVEGVESIDASISNGLDSCDVFLQGLKAGNGPELIILVGHNDHGAVVFKDGTRIDINEAVLKITEAGHVPIVLTCDSKEHLSAPGVNLVTDSTFYFEEFAKAITHAQKVLKDKGCHQFYVGDYIFSIDEYFHKRTAADKQMRFALKATGIGSCVGILIFAVATALSDDDDDKNNSAKEK